MDFDYRKSGYLLPEGCKDLIDAMQPESTFTEHECVVTTQLPKLRREDLEIIVDGCRMQIIAKRSGGEVPVDYILELPSGYTTDQARATFLRGELRIVIPKAAT